MLVNLGCHFNISFHNSKFLPVKQYFSTIKFYHKHLLEKNGGSAIAQFAYDATPLINKWFLFKKMKLSHAYINTWSKNIDDSVLISLIRIQIFLEIRESTKPKNQKTTDVKSGKREDHVSVEVRIINLSSENVFLRNVITSFLI